ncbi:MAG: serine/threonine-protein kinase [Rubricoccaceae bacterium]|nr:serine/threonine-protein kinase [Rubricoccaceae bacterium]
MATSPEQWSEIKALFEEASGVPADARARWLDEHCTNADVRAEVDRLFDTEADAERFFDTLGARIQKSSEHEISPPPEKISVWSIVREAGRGGMGCVYEAIRDDGLFDQRVAIKVVDSHAPRLVKRFQHERRILGRLEHPNICRLLDGGALDDGRPFLVMEYVEGQPITAYADTNNLSVDERLSLFLQVCDAVAFAHRHLIIHRDLKPSNVLVTKSGTVKLLDFGIAMLLDENGDATMLTRTGRRLLTPHYAAPEQILDNPITTATDVYALGVLLYVLLTGAKPFGRTGRSEYEIEQQVLEKTPIPPSTLVQKTGNSENNPTNTSFEPARLARRLRGDLDRIILKALRKEPERRYASAEALGRDIDRHLSGLPVEARPATAGYRIRSFIRRHRTGVSITVAIVALAAIFATLFAIRLTAERNRAEAQAARAEQVSEFLSDVLTRADDPTSSAAVFLRMIEPAVERAERELADNPEAQGVVYQVVGSLYSRAGRDDLALENFDSALRIRRDLHPEGSLDEAETLYSLGTVNIGRDIQLAASYFHQSAAMRRALVDGDDSDLAWSLLQYARMLPLDDPTKEEKFEEAMAMMRRVHGDRSFNVALALHEYYVLGLGSRSHEEVVDAFREALAIYEEVGMDHHPYYTHAMHNLGLALDVPGTEDEAVELLRRSVEIGQDVIPRGASGRFNMEINLGATLHEKGLFDEADTYLQTAADETRRYLPDSSSGIGQSHYWYGRNLISLGRYEQARDALQLALDIQQHNAYDGFRTLRTQAELALAYHHLGNQSEAERLVSDAIDRIRDMTGEERPLEHGLVIFEAQPEEQIYRERLAELRN